MEASTLPPNVLYYGMDTPPPEQIALRAGPLSLIFESGDLRYIRLGRREILRRVYVAVRDRNWGTVRPVLSNVRIEQDGDTFQISYEVENRQGEIDFFWRGNITGDARGSIRFTMDGQARSSFLRNRIGFCVLHPSDACAGAACQIEHVDGTVEMARFPQYIAPQALVDGMIHPAYPFANMRALAYETQPGPWADLRFAGETFEMEDQRNWTDASFKTYGTPLRLPFPVQVEQGTRITQSVTLTLRDDGRRTTDDGLEMDNLLSSLVVRPSSSIVPLPRIGLGVASHGQPLSERELDRLRALNLAHLRVDLPLASDDYGIRLRQAIEQARALGISLEVALTLSDAADELAELAGMLTELKPPVHSWLIFHAGAHSTAEQWMRLAREKLIAYTPNALFGGGTDANFTELNRARPPISALDLLCYSINPQVHAFDNGSLAETLAAQAVTVASARQFAGELPLAITPITLLPRFNPNATAPESAPAPGELPPQVDVRQMSLFGAVLDTPDGSLTLDLLPYAIARIDI
jgi:hypothetical protein